MIEGWFLSEYIVLFDSDESADLSRRYEIDKRLGEYRIIGLRDWDDFILEDPGGGHFLVPTAPLDRRYIRPLELAVNSKQLRADERYRGRIKWYVKPLVFGGDASSTENVIWVAVEKHIELVKWWNNLYQSMKQPR